MELMIRRLKLMDDNQLFEMFHDIDDLDFIERLANCASYYLEKNGNVNIEFEAFKKSQLPSITKLNFIVKKELENHACDAKNYLEKSEDQDAKELDDAQRLRDIKSDERRPY